MKKRGRKVEENADSASQLPLVCAGRPHCGLDLSHRCLCTLTPVRVPQHRACLGSPSRLGIGSYTTNYVNVFARRTKREDPGKGQSNATCLESPFKNLKSPRSPCKTFRCQQFQGAHSTGLPVRRAPSPVSRSVNPALTPSNMSGVKKLRTVSKSEDNGVTETSTSWHSGAAIVCAPPLKVYLKKKRHFASLRSNNTD